MKLSERQKMLCREIQAGHVRSIADYMLTQHKKALAEKRSTHATTRDDFSLGGDFNVHATTLSEDEGLNLRASMREFISLWFRLENNDLVRTVFQQPMLNARVLFKTQTNDVVLDELLYEECKGYLARAIVPLDELDDFISRGARHGQWLTHYERTERRILRNARLANFISLAIGIVAIVVTLSDKLWLQMRWFFLELSAVSTALLKLIAR